MDSESEEDSKGTGCNNQSTANRAQVLRNSVEEQKAEQGGTVQHCCCQEGKQEQSVDRKLGISLQPFVNLHVHDRDSSFTPRGV